MLMTNDSGYFAARAEASRRAANDAADPKIAALHMEFAAQYDLLRFEHRVMAQRRGRSRYDEPSQLAAPLAIASAYNRQGTGERHAAAW